MMVSMMEESPVETETLIRTLRLTSAEPTDVEVKAASGGCPRSLRETLSAFSNAGGGTILLGLTDSDFTALDVDADALRTALAGMAANDVTPPARGSIEIELFEGRRIVRMDVIEMDPVEKPCYVTAQGRYSGSYIRTADGDRRLSHYEINRLLENRTQPEFDREVVAEASVEDLDPGLIAAYLDRITQARPRGFAGLDQAAVMNRLGLTATRGGAPHPTLAALLTFSAYPQQFFPQLNITVVALPTPRMGDPGPNGERFLDNITCDGPIGTMLSDAIAGVTRNMTRAAVIEGTGRVDRYEYPLEVVRELLVNAVMHRDYSPGARGSQIQVELYPDRLVVRSPGGFYGLVDPADFGDPAVSSSRNALLARILADTPLGGRGEMLAENRGSGIPTVLRTLHRAGRVPPEFHADLRRVEVTVPHHALLTPEVVGWIDSLGQDLSQAQIQTLALLYSGKAVRNQTLQGWGIHAADATRELTDLVRRGLVVKVGDRRGASYLLADTAAETQRLLALTARQRAILNFLTPGMDVAVGDLIEPLGVGRATVTNDLNALIEAGLVVASAPPRSKNRTYRRTNSKPGKATP